MDQELKDVHEHMIRLGLGALAHANWHAHYSSMDNDMWTELSVLQAAHAAEILIKARIAQEHPLLIFEKLPKNDRTNGGILSFHDLIEKGRTYQYADLPDRLWATTGVSLPNKESFIEFGYLRNSIQHFSTPTRNNLSQETIEYIFSVIDPFIHDCWGVCAIDYCEDPNAQEYFIPGIISREILFHISPFALEAIESKYFEWPDVSMEYKHLMLARIAYAKEKFSQG